MAKPFNTELFLKNKGSKLEGKFKQKPVSHSHSMKGKPRTSHK